MEAAEPSRGERGRREIERIRTGTSLRHPLRSIDIGDYHDAFLIAAATMIIVIRLQLWITDYPQLGGGNLHIAHLLYGGVLMVVAVIFLASFVGRRPVLPGVIIGGLGFGFFIDEVGKFVTKDNDYFFAPTAVIIYIAFIVLYLGLRFLRTRSGFSQAEHLHNALELLGGGADGHLTAVDRGKALRELELAGEHPMVPKLREAALEAPVAAPEDPPWPVRAAARLRAFYYRQAARPGFPKAVGWLFGVWVFLNTIGVIGLVLVGLNLGDVSVGFEDDSLEHLNVANWASLLSTAVSLGFAYAGYVLLRRGDRVGAYTNFDRALLINLFVTHVFTFAESSFSATTGFLITLAFFFTFRYMLQREVRRDVAGPEEQDPAPPSG